MNFGQALEALKYGRYMTRSGWNGEDMHLAVQYPTDTSKMRKPYIYIYPVDGEPVPWVASQTDLLAEDWEEVL